MSHPGNDTIVEKNLIDSPHIITSSEHPITPDMIDKDALFVLRKLSQAGFSGYLVGGGVRDLYLGKKPKDFDISTDARPGQIRKLFPRSKTIGRRFRLVQVFFAGGKTIEVSTLRSMSEHDLDGPEAVLAPNNTFGSLSEDARRRDLTVNSLFYEIENGTIIDYVGGSKDLDNATIRMVGDPTKRVSRDPVRMMRAIRHSSRNSFQIEKKTWQAISTHSEKLLHCPPSRLRDELFKDLYSGSSAPWFTLTVDSNIFFHLFPIYKSVFYTPTALGHPHELLEKIFSTIDRVNNLSVKEKIHRQPDYFLLALILIPWVEAHHSIYTQFQKGAALNQISKQLRNEINQTIGAGLNLRRSMRQETVNLLCNLSLLLHHRKKGNWPKWLKKKSYFAKSALFYHFFTEITKDELLPDCFLRTSNPPNIKPSATQPPKTKKYKPAFSKKSKGGVFGFKK